MLILVGVAAAGCFGYTHCEHTPDGAAWHDAALWEAFDAPVHAAEGWPTGMDGVVVSSVSAGPRWSTVHYADGVVWANVKAPANATELAVSARMLLEHGTSLSVASIQTWVDAFIASERASSMISSHEFHDGHAVATPWREFRHAIMLDADTLYESVAFDGDPLNWTDQDLDLAFSADSKEGPLGPYRLRVNAFGDTNVRGKWPELYPDAEVQADVSRQLEEAGLPIPESMRISGFIC